MCICQQNFLQATPKTSTENSPWLALPGTWWQLYLLERVPLGSKRFCLLNVVHESGEPHVFLFSKAGAQAAVTAFLPYWLKRNHLISVVGKQVNQTVKQNKTSLTKTQRSSGLKLPRALPLALGKIRMTLQAKECLSFKFVRPMTLGLKSCPVSYWTKSCSVVKRISLFPRKPWNVKS